MCKRVWGRSDEGAALMIALGVLAILAMLGGAFVVFMRIEQSRAEYDLDALRARYIARGGIEVARVRVEKGDAPSGELTGSLAGGTYTVRIRQGERAYEAEATGTFLRRNGSLVSTTISALIGSVEGSVYIERWQE